MKLHTSDLVWALRLSWTPELCVPFLYTQIIPINSPNGVLVIIIRLQNLQPNGSWYPVAGNAYLHTGGVLNRWDQGERAHPYAVPLYLLQILELPLSSSLWLEDETILPGRTRDISKGYQTMVWVTFFWQYYIAWNFRWWGWGEMGWDGADWQPVPVVRTRQHRGCGPTRVLRPGLFTYCKR